MEDYSKERSFTPVVPFTKVDDKIKLLTEKSGRKKKSGEAYTSYDFKLIRGNPLIKDIRKCKKTQKNMMSCSNSKT